MLSEREFCSTSLSLSPWTAHVGFLVLDVCICPTCLCVVQEEPRRELLGMTDGQLEDVARVCNRYPDIQLTYQLEGGNSVAAGGQVTLTAQMERELEGDLRPVDAPR